MMQPGDKKIYLLVFASLLVAGALLMLALGSGGGAQREAMTDRIGELKIAARVRMVQRSVFGGEPFPGNAWDEYNIALDDALKLATDEQDNSIYLQFANGEPGADAVKVRQLVGGQSGTTKIWSVGRDGKNQNGDGDW